jgi:hypothetical protein
MGAAFLHQDTTRPNRVSAYIWDPSGGEGSGAYFEDALTPGEWMHVVAVYDPGDMDTPLAGVRLYKNGVLRKGPPHRGTLYATYDIVPADTALPFVSPRETETASSPAGWMRWRSIRGC